MTNDLRHCQSTRFAHATTFQDHGTFRTPLGQEHGSHQFRDGSAGMSTRKGKVEFLEDVLNDAKNTMHEVMKENPAKYAEIADPEGTSDTLAISAIVVQDMAAKRVRITSGNLDVSQIQKVTPGHTCNTPIPFEID